MATEAEQRVIDAAVADVAAQKEYRFADLALIASHGTDLRTVMAAAATQRAAFAAVSASDLALFDAVEALAKAEPAEPESQMTHEQIVALGEEVRSHAEETIEQLTKERDDDRENVRLLCADVTKAQRERDMYRNELEHLREGIRRLVGGLK
jgi:hypothetical protein